MSNIVSTVSTNHQVNNEQCSIDYVVQNNDFISHTVHRHELPVTDQRVRVIHEDEEVVVDFPMVVVEDAADVVESLKTEADLRKEGRIGDVASVASRTIPTGWNVTSATTPSQQSLSLQIPTPWMTPGTRSSS